MISLGKVSKSWCADEFFCGGFEAEFRLNVAHGAKIFLNGNFGRLFFISRAFQIVFRSWFWSYIAKVMKV